MEKVIGNMDKSLIEGKKYWLKKLEEHDITRLEFDDQKLKKRLRIKGTYEFDINPQIYDNLIKLTNQKSFLLYTVLISVLFICLYKYSGKRNIIIGSPCLKSYIKEQKNLVVITNEINKGMTFRQFLLNVRQGLLEDYRWQSYPYVDLINNLGMQIDDEKFPLFSISIALDDLHNDMPDVPSDINLIFSQQNEKISGRLQFDKSLYNDETIEKFVLHYSNVLNQITRDNNICISDIKILTDKEIHKQLVEWNSTAVDYSKEKYIHQLFEEQVERSPNSIAVECKDRYLTYQELNTRANQLAHYLKKLGIGPKVLVAICLKPSVDMVVGLFGILKTGGAYVPIDSTYPRKRINLMLKDSIPKAIITSEDLEDIFIDLEAETILLDKDWKSIEKHEKYNPVHEEVVANNPAYVIYTSGSTGKPKGAAVDQLGWINLINWFITEFSISSEDKSLLISSFSFDLTQKNIFAPLIVGGQLQILSSQYYDSDLVLKEVNDKKITLLNCTPSVFYAIVDNKSDDVLYKLSSLRNLFLGGEKVSMSRLNKWVKSGHCRVEIVNTYGPTECTDICAFYRINKFENLESVPIGKPIFNTKLLILNRENEIIPVGLPGELCVIGDGVGLGYINDVILTNEKFILNPYEKDTGGRIYKTGDLARYLPDGNIQYLSRIDHQVKIRGFRIELGEIETIIKSHPAVQEAVVLVRDSVFGDKKLSAYLVPDGEHASVIKNLLFIQKGNTVENQQLYNLPNDMTIFHLNKSETDFVYREIFEEQAYFQEGIVLSEGSTILDVGANIGLFTLFVSMMCKKCNIYSFEPIAPIFQVLKNNVELYGLNVNLFNHGISDTNKSESITYYPHISIMSGRYADTKADHDSIMHFISRDRELTGKNKELSVEEINELIKERLKSEVYSCNFKTISDVIEENSIKQVDLLKIDVEKSEMDILKGIKECHWGKIEQIVMEIHDIKGRLEQVKALLVSKGYKTTIKKDEKLEDSNIYNVYARQWNKGQDSNKIENYINGSDNTWTSSNKLSNDLKQYVKENLPEYMIPSEFIFLQEIPLSPNGKVDRDALLKIDTGLHKSVEMALPTNYTEETVSKVWEEVLGVDRLSIDDVFMDLGGHSLLATVIISQLRKVFGKNIPIFLFFENPTVRKLSAAIEMLKIVQ